MSKAFSLYNAVIGKNKIFFPLQGAVTVPLNVPNLIKGSARLAKIWAQLLLLVSRRLFPITHQAGGLAGGVCWGRAG